MGVGLYLLLMGLLLEAMTLFARRWISFPVPLGVGVRIALTIPCLLIGVSGIIWFNFSINLVKVHLVGAENKLITEGLFNYVRHPLYATLLISLPPLMIIWYADLVFILPWGLIFMIAHYVVLLEERGLVKTFGQDYQRYQKFVPALFPYKGAGGKRYRRQGGSPASDGDGVGQA